MSWPTTSAAPVPRAPRAGTAAYGLEQLTADFEAVCEALAPGRRVHLVGHDWGGIQGWEFATTSPGDVRLASFTAIAAPALGHAAHAVRERLLRGRVLGAIDRLRRSWYILALLLPGGPSVAWRMLLSGQRWRSVLQVAERVPVDDDFPSSTVTANGLHGANLYRANIPRRLMSPVALPQAQVPVQLIVPSGDRFISESYYRAAEQVAPGLRRRTLAGSHWAPRAQPDLVSRWIAEFVGELETGSARPRAGLAARRRAGATGRPAGPGHRSGQRNRPGQRDRSGRPRRPVAAGRPRPGGTGPSR